MNFFLFFFKEGTSKLCVENRKGSTLFTVCLREGNSINSCTVAQESSEQSLLSKAVPRRNTEGLPANV